MNETQTSDLYVKNRRELEMSGVKEVLTYSSDTVEALTVLGKLVLRGEELKIISFCAETGQLSVKGRMAGWMYTDDRGEREGLLRRLFR